MKSALSRRDFVRSSALAAAFAVPNDAFAIARVSAPSNAASPILLGLASYTFRNFSRAQLISFMKQLNLSAANLKDAKDHLPSATPQEIAALADYAAAGIKLHAAGTVYFDKDEDADIRDKFEYCKRAGISVVVAGDPAPETLPRIEKFVREYNIRFAIHNHGPEDKLWHSPLDVLKAVKGLDPRIGCCIDVGHTVRAGTDVVQAIHEAGPRLFNVHMKDLTKLPGQRKPSRRRRRQHARAENISSPSRNRLPRFRGSRIRNSSRRPKARRHGQLCLHARRPGRPGRAKAVASGPLREKHRSHRYTVQ